MTQEQEVVQTQANVEQNVVQQVSTPLYDARGWMKLTAILSIINGVLIALSIIGILIAWLPIWMGVVLYKSASEVEPAREQGNKMNMIESLGNLKTYFTIIGVLNLLGIIFLVGTLCLALIGIISGAAWLDSFNYY